MDLIWRIEYIRKHTGKDIPILLRRGPYSKVEIHEEFFKSLISGLKKKNQCLGCQFMINFMYVMNTAFI